MFGSEVGASVGAGAEVVAGHVEQRSPSVGVDVVRAGDHEVFGDMHVDNPCLQDREGILPQLVHGFDDGLQMDRTLGNPRCSDAMGSNGCQAGRLELARFANPHLFEQQTQAFNRRRRSGLDR